MTIPNANRLAFLRQTTAAQSSTYTEVERFEFISILDELMLSRERFGAVAGDAAADINARKLYVGDKPTDIEALAQRLAKVEDRLAEKGFDDAFHIGAGLKRVAALEKRLDQVVEIFANANIARVADHTDLRERFEKLEASARAAAPLPFGVQPNPPGFPTGAATTVEDAIAQVEEPGAESDTSPPQRGDRVRLEGARTHVARRLLGDRWYDVIGHDVKGGDFQIQETAHRAPWLPFSDAVKEVRRGGADLPE